MPWPVPPILWRVTALKCSTITCGFLRDVVRVQPHETGQRPRGLLALDVGIVLAGFQQFEVGGVGRVVLQHVEDEAFLDGLPHRVLVERLAVPPEDRQRLVLGRGGEGERSSDSTAGRVWPCCERVPSCRLSPSSAAVLFASALQLLAAEDFLQVRGRFAGLRAVRLVHDDRAFAGGQNAACLSRRAPRPI